ncbi:MAG: hypothetical protein IKM81_09635 [Fibrobacter sp.]|nr:hypothetical protein [Fibrobacter sp.]
MPPWNQTIVPVDVLLPAFRQTPTGMSGDLFPAENMKDAFLRGFLFLMSKVSDCGAACAKQNATEASNNTTNVLIYQKL